MGTIAEHLSQVLATSLLLVSVEPFRGLAYQRAWEQTEPNGIRSQVLYGKGVAQLQELLYVNTGVLMSFPTKWTLHHRD